MQWTERYSIHRATCGILELSCAWQNGGYVVRVNHSTLKQSCRNPADAKAAAIEHARRLLAEASAMLDVLELEGHAE